MTPHDQEIELYHHPESLCSQKVRVALAEKNLGYKSPIVRLSDIAKYDPATAGRPGAGTNLDPDYLAINPTGILPTLVFKGVPVYDSYRIIRHLDDAFPERGDYRLARRVGTSRVRDCFWQRESFSA